MEERSRAHLRSQQGVRRGEHSSKVHASPVKKKKKNSVGERGPTSNGIYSSIATPKGRFSLPIRSRAQLTGTAGGLTNHSVVRLVSGGGASRDEPPSKTAKQRWWNRQRRQCSRIDQETTALHPLPAHVRPSTTHLLSPAPHLSSPPPPCRLRHPPVVSGTAAMASRLSLVVGSRSTRSPYSPNSPTTTNGCCRCCCRWRWWWWSCMSETLSRQAPVAAAAAAAAAAALLLSPPRRHSSC